MKKILCLFFLLSQLAYSQYDAPVFQMREGSDCLAFSMNIRTAKDSIVLLKSRDVISGLFLSGSAILADKRESYVRVTLKGDRGEEYLVYELYPILAEDSLVRFSKMAIETASLNSVNPILLGVEAKNAEIRIDTIFYTSNDASISSEQFYAHFSAIRQKQCEFIASKLNRRLVDNKLSWRAGLTSIAQLSYEEKKAALGGKVPMLYGLEYYKGGVFILPDFTLDKKYLDFSRNADSLYVKDWDWRDRHGKNWLTQVKLQGGCGSCWAFAAVGALESYINLYYNQKFDYNLSEQELLSCSQGGNCSGGFTNIAMDYIKDYGIVTEDCFSYMAANSDCSNKCLMPTEKISIENFLYYQHDNDTNFIGWCQLKELLIRRPLCVDIHTWGHSVVLAGYKTIVSGNNYFTASSSQSPIVFTPNNTMVGGTALLIKNSWGDDWGDDGYGYVATSLYNLRRILGLTGRATSNLLHEEDIICGDEDGDGYYFWGIGSKPNTCPLWVPDTPDGDDSDYTKGPIDGYGNLYDITSHVNDVTQLPFNTSWYNKRYVYNNIVIPHGVTLTIFGEVVFYDGAKITLQGGNLIVDGGHLINSEIEISEASASQIMVINDGAIDTRANNSFEIPIGVEFKLNEGRIN